jgi:RNA polymerase sigma-70 factor (ECF subfamily)
MTNDDPPDRTTQVQLRLDRLREGDESVRAELLKGVNGRLGRLAEKMLKDFPGVARWEQTDDVLQGALLRLDRALRASVPPTGRDFFCLAAALIRRELIDLSRHHFGRGGGKTPPAALGVSDDGIDPVEPTDSTLDPRRLALWTEFHRQVDVLPEEDRELFDLLWYQGLEKSEVAALLGVTERTVNRRWVAARLSLVKRLGGELPI